MEEWPSSALRMRTTNHVLESSVDWSLYINIKKKNKQDSDSAAESDNDDNADDRWWLRRYSNCIQWVY